MREAVIVSTARTGLAKSWRGALNMTHGATMGGHVVRDIVVLKAPNKDGRRKVLELLMKQVGSADATNEWMEGSEASRPSSVHGGLEGLKVEPALDLLDVAAQTDGYMPGDIVLLVSRTRSECLIRTVTQTTSSGFNHNPRHSSRPVSRRICRAGAKPCATDAHHLL